MKMIYGAGDEVGRSIKSVVIEFLAMGLWFGIPDSGDYGGSLRAWQMGGSNKWKRLMLTWVY